MSETEGSRAAKFAAKQMLLAGARRATEALPQFSTWLLAGLGAAFSLLLANLEKTTQFIDIRYVRAALFLLLLSLVIAVLTTYLTMMVKSALGAQEDGDALGKAVASSVANIDLDVFTSEFQRSLIPPYRWLAECSMSKARAGDTLVGVRLIAKLSQAHALLVVLQSVIALLAVGALAFGLKLQ